MNDLLDPEIGAVLLSDLGFLHVPGRPSSMGRAYLFVALRPQPTQRHFDPEQIDYWVDHDGRGAATVLDRNAHGSISGRFAWGNVRVVDRKGIFNEWAAFGGDLSRQWVDDVEVAVFSSEAPIAALGGHSEGFDLAAPEMAAFLARLRAAAGADREFEAELAGVSPLDLYAAFITDELTRQHDGHGRIVGDPLLVESLVNERRRLAGGDWGSGVRIAERLGRLGRAVVG